MAKLTILVALLVALMAFTEASYRAIITTTTIEEENRGGQQSRCREQVQSYRLRSCQRYLSQGSPYADDQEMINQQHEQQSLRQCCNELRNIDEQCRCEAIRQVVRQQQGEGGSYRGEEMQRVIQKAQYLPRSCNMRSPQQCQIRAVLF